MSLRIFYVDVLFFNSVQFSSFCSFLRVFCCSPIVEQAEYHMFCREKAELYLPEMYNKIGVGLMAWGPLSMSLSENSEKLLFSKGSFKTKSQSYSWCEEDLNKDVRNNDIIFLCYYSYDFVNFRIELKKQENVAKECKIWQIWRKNWDAQQHN